MPFQPIVGAIKTEDQMRFKRLMFRVSRGKAHAQFFPVD